MNPVATEATKVTRKEAQALDKQAKSLIDQVESSYFTLGSVLSQIARTGCFADLGCESFNQYIEDHLEFARRKAFYLIAIYEKAVELGVNEKKLAKIGGTKAREVIGIAERANLNA